MYFWSCPKSKLLREHVGERSQDCSVQYETRISERAFRSRLAAVVQPCGGDTDVSTMPSRWRFSSVFSPGIQLRPVGELLRVAKFKLESTSLINYFNSPYLLTRTGRGDVSIDGRKPLPSGPRLASTPCICRRISIGEPDRFQARALMSVLDVAGAPTGLLMHTCR